MLFEASTVFERRMYFMKAGIATAARMPMIATTIMSSIRVKPFIIFFFISRSPLSKGFGKRVWEPGLLVLVLRNDGAAVERGDVLRVRRDGLLVVALGVDVEPGRARHGLRAAADGALALGAGHAAPGVGRAGDGDVAAIEL